MTNLEYIHFKSRTAFHDWLHNNHEKSPGIWMVFYKKHTNTGCIKYDEALDEALCYGWIDSLIKKIDEEKYARKFTPRTNLTKWSEINKRKVTELIKTGRMNEAGLKKIDIYLKSGKVGWENKEIKERTKEEITMPDYILREFAMSEPALSNFNRLPATYQRHYILWITNAKRTDTINKRVKESIALLKENKILGLK
jgi:uncharacterized protein YdeI (YjbR/CyaY-like superfamily)